MNLKKKQFWESSAMNNVTFLEYYNRLLELATARFEWSGLPDTADERYLELSLYAKGMCLFFKDEVLGYLTLQCTTTDHFNVYGIPLNRIVTSPNGYTASRNDKDSVIIYNNRIHTSPMAAMQMYARRLYNYDRIIDVNSNAQKTPVLLTCDEQQRMTLVNLYKQWDGNEPVIYGSKQLNNSVLNVLKTDAPYICDKIQMLKTETWNEALTFLGISNVNVQKKERMLVDEVTRNMGGVLASRNSSLKARQEACKQINNMFGLNVRCDFSDDYRIVEDITADVESEGGENIE